MTKVVTLHNIGIKTEGKKFEHIIPKNTPLPNQKSQTFTTAVDNQSSVEIHILEGEGETAADSRSLGRFHLDGIPPAPKGVPQIEVVYKVDTEGKLLIHAKDLGTDKEQSSIMKERVSIKKMNDTKMSVKIASKEYHELSDAEIRELFDEWSKTKKSVTTNFGDLINIVRKTNKDSFQSILQTEYETRKMEHRFAPYSGGTVDDKGKIPDMWDISIDRPADFENKTQTLRLPHTEKILTCSICKGNGKVVCPVCDGQEKVRCPECLGDGKIVCRSCKGTGKKNCIRCGGFGYLKHDESSLVDMAIGHAGKAGDTCPDCKGVGDVACDSCSGEGYKTCLTCSGSGLVRCDRCHGLGFVFCSVCQGKGENIHWEDVVIDFSFDTDITDYNEVEKLEEVKEATAWSLMDDKRFSKYFAEREGISASEPFLIEDIDQKLSDLPVIDEKIMPQIEEMLVSEDVNYNTQEDCRRLFQELKVLFLPITEIEYSYKDKTYEAWIYGANKCVHIEKAPNVVFDKMGDFGKKVKGLFKKKER